MTDLYIFPKPGEPARSVIVLNVHPSVALDSRERTTSEPFKPGASYEIKIDTNGDAVADICYSVQFASCENGKQTATVRRTEGARAVGVCDDGEIIVENTAVSVEREALVSTAGDHRFFFGWRSDSFFFDVDGNVNHNQFTGEDFFADKDVCSIVIELPNAALGNDKIGIWARTVDKTDEGWVQADRGARPMQAIFLSGEQREAYLSGEPANDDRFIGVFAHELEHSGGYPPEEAKEVARRLLPDFLSYNPHEPMSYPHNGRKLVDDVVDVFITLLTNGKVTGDAVGPHDDLRDEFPYLAPPHFIECDGPRAGKPFHQEVSNHLTQEI